MIKRKKPDANIISKEQFTYNPATFAELKKPQFIEATAEQVLGMIKPMDWNGTKLIAIDTETYAYLRLRNNDMLACVVRRWIKQGAKEIPNDFPFCYSICDGTHSFVVYDTFENHFKEFKKLEPLLSDRSIDKVGHNLDYDLHMIANTGVDIKGRLHDSMYVSKLTRADAFTHRLLDMAEELYDPITCPTVGIFEHMLDSYKAQYRINDYRQFPRELMTQYTSADTWNTIYSFINLFPRLAANNQTEIYDIECKNLLVAYYMERRGIQLEPAYKEPLIKELSDEANVAEQKIYDTAGKRFNINSGKQLEEVLCSLGYKHLIEYKDITEAGLAKGDRHGNACFDKHAMEKLEDAGVPLIADINTYRKAEKLLNTFAIKLYEMCDKNNIVHCNINTIEAKTGRFSISSPSMQNMPRRNDSRVRDAFIAPPGFTLYDGDFKSQESIILVHYSHSKYLMDIILSGGDIHKAVASIIYSIDYKDVTKELRGISKSVEFAIVYGAGASKVSAMTGLSIQEAGIAMKSFLKNAPEVNIFINTANKVARERKFIKTIKNRIVYVEKGREYACVNYVIQGSAADSTKSRMVELFAFLRGNKLKSEFILQVHDSLLYQIANDELNVLPYLKWLQTEKYLFRVPVEVDFAKCDGTWRNKNDIELEKQEPPKEMMEAMQNFDYWSLGLFDRLERIG